ncbi:serine hydrolase domain-containing protein, partial [Nonomuraea sp. NPDC048901]|uniref:serine hydrolase domain-containing protein n=1 Tax=Nonomuraea sp. NPDC048901 TaxID=3155627 RepID=UPI0033F55551
GPVERADEITVQQLIQHTSGIPDWWSRSGSTEPAFDVFDFTTYYRPIDIVETTRGLPRTGEPGEKFTYSNTNYTLIGMIIEKVTGHTLADELDRRLFRPLGMTRTYALTKPPEGIKGPHGHGYHADSTGALRDMHHANASWGFGAGNVSTSCSGTGRCGPYRCTAPEVRVWGCRRCTGRPATPTARRIRPPIQGAPGGCRFR